LQRAYRNWIFDLDGTLTIAVHDFQAIRGQLGLGGKLPILETIRGLPEWMQPPLHRKLDEIELDLARATQVRPGAKELLSELYERGANLGVLTRNTTANAWVTLEAAGLQQFFRPEHVLGRDACPPKPDPTGVVELLSRWCADANDTVLVGDYIFDLEAARRAKLAAAIYLDVAGNAEFSIHADLCVNTLGELRLGRATGR